MLDAVEPNEKAEEPNETSAALPEGSCHATMPPVPNSQIQIWTTVERRGIARIWLDIDLDFQIFVLLPKLHDLISQADGHAFDLRLQCLVSDIRREILNSNISHP